MRNKGLASVIIFTFLSIWVNGLSTFLSAQDVSYTASAPAAVQLSEQFQYVIEGSERGDVQLPALSDFQLLAGPFSSYSSHSQWINGKMTMKTIASYTYVLRAVGSGTFAIPPATVRVGRKEYKTNEVQVVVSASNPPAGGAPGKVDDPATPDNTLQDAASGESTESDPVFLRITPSKKEVYVGEQFVSGLKVYTRVNTRPASSSRDIPYEGFYKISLDPDASAQRQDINGQQYVSQVIQRHILIPQKSGDLVIPPFESEWMMQQRVQRRNSNSPFDSFFDDPFFNGYQDVPVKLATRPLTIHVRALPPGAPEGFNGAVGDFSMAANLSSSEVEVNEAISLKLTIRGTGNLPLLGQPEVNLPPDHDLYDVTKSLNTSTSGNRISGTVTFEYPIVARHAGRFRIAPIQFSWFNPVTGKYHHMSSEEFNFTVVKGESEEDAAGAYVPGVMHESVDDLGTDIRDISREFQNFSSTSSSLFGSRWYKWIYPILFLMGLLVILLIRLLTKRNADLSLVRNRQANKMARVRLKKADRLRKSDNSEVFYEEIGKAIWGYLSDKLNIETSKLSKDVVQEQLDHQQIAVSLQDELLRIMEESEFSRFAPSSEKSEVNQLYNDAVSLIRNLENNLR